MKEKNVVRSRTFRALLVMAVCSILMIFGTTVYAADHRMALPLDGTWKENTINVKEDIVWYDFTIPADGKVDFVFQTFRGATIFKLYDDDLVQMYHKAGLYRGSAQDPKMDSFTTYLAAGTYHVKVHDDVYGSGFDGAGKVRAKMTYTSAGSTEKEPNNTFSSAMTLQENTQVNGTLILLDDRYDFYTFTLPEAKAVEIIFGSYAGEINNGSYVCKLFNEEFEAITDITARGDGVTPEIKKIQETLDKGKYYIKIYDNFYRESNSCGRYTLKWKNAVCEHTWDSGMVTKEATCTQTGVKTLTCTKCKATTTESLSATGHTWDGGKVTKAATCTAQGVKTTTCTKCKATIKESIPATGHKAGAWKVTKAATGTSTGVRQKNCTVCNAVVQKQTIAKTKVTLNAATLPLQVKKSTTALKIKTYTKGDAVKSWKSSNPSIVSVNAKNGKLTARKTGTATITLTMKSGAKASCKVKVQKGVVKTTKLTLSKTSVTLKAGQTFTVGVKRLPLTANDKVTFKSSNTKTATVSSTGKITAKKKGTATITVRTASGKTAKIKVYVK